MLLHQIVAPTLAPLLPMFDAASGGGGEVDRLSRAVEKLQATVKDQQAEIEKLRHRR
jgi:hypothetical protein